MSAIKDQVHTHHVEPGGSLRVVHDPDGNEIGYVERIELTAPDGSAMIEWQNQDLERRAQELPFWRSPS